MRYRGRWPERDYTVPGLVTVSMRMTGEEKQWIDDTAERTGQSLAGELRSIIQRARAAEIDLLSAQDLTFGLANTGIMLLTGLILSEAQRNATEEWGRDADTDAIVATALGLTIGLVFDVDLVLPRPNTMADEIFDTRVRACLRPVYEIRAYLHGERASPARLLDEKIAVRLGEELCKRIAALAPQDAAPDQPKTGVLRDHPQFVGRMHFRSAVEQARATLLSQSSKEPSKQEIAAYIASDAILKYYCGLHTTPQSAVSILQYWDQVLPPAEPAPPASTDETTDAADATPPLRARSSRSRKRSEASDRQV
jgi:hypothetical protein